jgi:RNA polymerase sigma factor (sigma-70 family)
MARFSGEHCQFLQVNGVSGRAGQLNTGMVRTLLTQDKALAQRICEALLAGNRQPLEEMVSSYEKLFLPFARRRLFQTQDVEDVLQNFWEELMNGKAICRYAQETAYQVTLRSFCLGILNHRIIDRNRQTSRERQRLSTEDPPAGNPGNSPEDLLTQSASDNLARSLVHAALIRLAEQSPRDMELVRWHLDGLSYEDMAKRLLGPDQTATATVRKKINAVKKQFTRVPSGSLARFKAVLGELMQARGLSYDDF